MKTFIRIRCGLGSASRRVACAVLLGVMGSTLSVSAADAPSRGVFPPGAEAYGKSLQEWLSIYWRWNMSGADPSQSVVDGVQLLPIPAGEVTGGSFTPDDPLLLTGQLEFTLPADTPFVLPAFAWLGERYEGYPEVPDDPPVADDVILAGTHPNLTIDGLPVLTDENKADYYIPVTYFDPIIEYAEPTDYGAVGAVFFQGAGFVSAPLPVGQHIIHLYEPLILPAGAYPGVPDGLGIVFDNTWIITVPPEAARGSGRNPNPGVLPPGAHAYGQSYGEWAAAWWQWALGVPADQNPLIDETGEFCGVGQSGPVWFLPGTFGTSVERDLCVVPKGKSVFFPVYNWLFGAGIFDCEPTVPGVECDVEALRQGAAEQTETAEVLEATIDGVPVGDLRAYRASSPEPFELVYPENNVVEVPAGEYYPHITDGYWLMLAPLKPGAHTIRLYVRAPDTLFGLVEFEVVTHFVVE